MIGTNPPVSVMAIKSVGAKGAARKVVMRFFQAEMYEWDRQSASSSTISQHMKLRMTNRGLRWSKAISGYSR